MSSKNYEGRPTKSFVILVLLVCLLAVIAITLMLRAMIIPSQLPATTTDSAKTTDGPSAETTAPQPDESTAPPAQTDTTADSATTEVPAVTTEPLPQTVTLPKAETPADSDYFSSILFIGDSRTQGLYISTGGYGATFYADRGLAIDGVSTKKFIAQQQSDGTNTFMTITEKLTESPHTGKIYIWLGLNELGWGSSEQFEKVFRLQLAAIQATSPEADIVLMSVLPVGRSAVVIGRSSSAEANAYIVKYNDIIYRLAEEAGVYYLNCYEAFVDEEGYLPDDYASDGIHLVRDQNLALCDYILAHPVPATE